MLLYEDIVYGINSFRTWIYGYGSPAIVLDPKELREHIIESLNAYSPKDTDVRDAVYEFVSFAKRNKCLANIWK